MSNLLEEVKQIEEGFASDAQRRAAFASGYKEKGKKKKEEVEETLDKKDEPKLKQIVKKLKKASDAHAGQASDLEKAMSESKMKELASKIADVYMNMKKDSTMKPFADKFRADVKKSLDIRKSLEKVLPDYVGGGEITSIMKEEDELDELTIADVIKATQKAKKRQEKERKTTGKTSVSTADLASRRKNKKEESELDETMEDEFGERKAPKVDPAKFAAFMDKKKKPKRMSSTQKALSSISKKADKMSREEVDLDNEDESCYIDEDSLSRMKDSAIEALHRLVQSKGSKASLGSHAFEIAKSYENLNSRELEKMYVDKYGMPEEDVKVIEGYFSETKSSTGYELFHNTLGSAIDTAVSHAKSKFGISISDEERMDKVGLGPRKPSKGKTNSYRLMGTDKSGKSKGVQVQVYNMGNKFELNMYKESIDEAINPRTVSNAAKELETYAKKSGGIDKKDFMDVAADMKKGLTPRLANTINGLDTEPVEKIAMILKKHVGEKETEKYLGIEFFEDDELDEMKEPFVVVDTADGDKVVGMASSEKGAMQIITTAQLPPMKIKDKKTLKIVKVKKKQMIGRPIKEEVELDEAKSQGMFIVLEKGSKNKVIGQFKDKKKAIDMMKKNAGSKVIQIGKFATLDDKPVDIKVGDELSYTRVKLSKKIKEEVELDEAKISMKGSVMQYYYVDPNGVVQGVGSKDAMRKMNVKQAKDGNKGGHFSQNFKKYKVGDKIKEEIDEASKEGTIRIIDLGTSRQDKIRKELGVDGLPNKGFQVQRMTKGKFVNQGKPYKSQKDAEKVRKDGQHSMQFETIDESVKFYGMPAGLSKARIKADRDVYAQVLGIKEAIDPADLDIKATMVDKAQADNNIMIQLRKVLSLRNAHKGVVFADGSKQKVNPNVAAAAITMQQKLRRTDEKDAFQKKISKSYKDLLNAVKGK